MYQIYKWIYLFYLYLKVLDHAVNWCPPFAWKNRGRSCSLFTIILRISSSNIFFNTYQDDNQKREIIKSKICQNIKDINSLLILIWETLMSWDIHVIFTADLQQSTDTWTDEVPWGTHHWIQAREETRWLGMWRSLILLHLATSFSLRKIIKISYF